MKAVLNQMKILIWTVWMLLAFSACTREVTVMEIRPEQIGIIPKEFTPDSILFKGLMPFPEIRLMAYSNYLYRKEGVDINTNMSQSLQQISKRPYATIVTSGFSWNTNGQNYEITVNLSNMQYIHQQKDWIHLMDSLQFFPVKKKDLNSSIVVYVPEGKEMEMSEAFRKLDFVESANPVLQPRVVDEKANMFRSLWKNI